MQEKITAFINDLIIYDYLLFGASIALFMLFMLIGIALRRKIFLAMLFILLSFLILILAPTIGYIKMHEYLFKNSVELSSQKQLTFTKAVVIKGRLTNNAKRNFSSCTITAKAHKVTSNKLKNFLYSYRSFKEGSILLQNIEIGQMQEFKMFLEPFSYSKKYEISLGASCK
ncbi:MAG: DUF2393 family protein [Sulfurimonas sp.]|nr:DUF2393 family protein [Sulfurimonas sp.]